MAKKRRFVGVGLFAKRKDAGLPNQAPVQSGTIAPTDKKSESFGSRFSKGSKQRKYHGQQAK